MTAQDLAAVLLVWVSLTAAVFVLAASSAPDPEDDDRE